MNKYKYVATDRDGKVIRGTFVAESDDEMKEILLKAGYYIAKYRQISSIDLASISLSGKIKAKELSQFCNQFSVMINAGISIVDAVEVCANQTFSPRLRSALRRIRDDLKLGVVLSDAMAKHPRVFPPFFSNMVYVGETAGCLDKVLVSVAEYYTLEEKTKKKIVSSLAYPVVLLIMLVVVVIAMMVFVIPRFKDSFGKMNVEMPALTMAIFDMSEFMQENWFVVLGLILAIIIVLWALHFIPSVRLFYHKLKVTLPGFKKINMAVFTSRFCRSLGLLLDSGADSLSALITLKKTITNKYLEKRFERVIKDVSTGVSLSQALASEMKISPILIQMIIVGEKTGELAQILLKTAPYFDSEAENSLNLITTMVQPAVMILLGAGVAVLFLAIYLPILSSIQSLQV